VVESLDGAISFSAELGLELEGRAMIEGDWSGRVSKAPMNFRCATGLYCVRIRKRGSADTPGSTGASMTQPVTELNARFSDLAAVAADWDQTRRTVEDAELFWIATVRADGRPHATPLVGRHRFKHE